MRPGRMNAEELTGTYDAIAAHWDKTRTKPWPQTLEFLKDGGGHLLDIGCGTGRNTEYALSRGWGSVTAVDISAGQLEVARSRVGNAPNWVRCDCREMPFDDETFDAFISIAVVHHIDSAEGRLKAMAEARRVLKRGGRGLVSVWSIEHEKFSDTAERDVLVPWTMHDGRVFQRYYHLFDQKELDELCVAAGFVVTRGEKGAGNNHAWVMR